MNFFLSDDVASDMSFISFSYCFERNQIQLNLLHLHCFITQVLANAINLVHLNISIFDIVRFQGYFTGIEMKLMQQPKDQVLQIF